MAKELGHKDVWKGEFRGVRFEVVHWHLGWNYYLEIPLEQLPKEVRCKFNLRSHTYKLSDDGQEHIAFDYGGKPIISDLDWHGGITLYEKLRDDRGKVVGFRLGCDYMHYWDEKRHFDYDFVVAEARQSIGKLWELIPNLLLSCAWNGKYYPAEEMFETDKGVRVALENKPKWEKPI